jgi:putative endonuclease
MYWIYILQSLLNNRYYVGSTNNKESQLEKHNHGYVYSTKAYRPWIIVYSESFQTLKDARHREKQIKNWKSRESIEKLIHASIV